jgi:hypothetical protein
MPGNDEDDSIRSVLAVPLDCGSALDNANRKDLVTAEWRFLTTRVSHAVDDEEKRDLRRRGRQRRRDSGRRLWRCRRTRRFQWRLDALRGPHGWSGEQCERGDEAYRVHSGFRATSTSSVSIHYARSVNPLILGSSSSVVQIRPSRCPLPRPGRTNRDPWAEKPASALFRRSCRTP